MAFRANPNRFLIRACRNTDGEARIFKLSSELRIKCREVRLTKYSQPSGTERATITVRAVIDHRFPLVTLATQSDGFLTRAGHQTGREALVLQLGRKLRICCRDVIVTRENSMTGTERATLTVRAVGDGRFVFVTLAAHPGRFLTRAGRQAGREAQIF